ncbi:MAG TPA: hypothetical protein VNJ04_07930 [Gemmatimonadaceae bacterium]|nr:hypothetical protein [Gemmatimonadaceae bacterium]
MAMRLHAKGREIETVDDWFKFAGPKGKERQWQDYRSAKELARAWCVAGKAVAIPTELFDLLESHPLTRGVDLRTLDGTPELRVYIDRRAGEPRNTDLAFTASIPSLEGDSGQPRRVAISVEAKADESFGQRVAAAISAAELRRSKGKRSFGDERARMLIGALLGEAAVADPAVGRLRYQLFTAAAGALAYARDQRADIAVLVFHEFVHSAGLHTRASKLAANCTDLNAFLDRFTQGVESSLKTDMLSGPFSIPGNADVPGSIPLLIGKVRKELP